MSETPGHSLALATPTSSPTAPHDSAPPSPPGPSANGLGRIPVLDVGPAVDGGRWPAKAVVAEVVPVTATVFREGHDAVAATAVLLDPEGRVHTTVAMHLESGGTDRWRGQVVPDREGRWSFRVEGWDDPYASWQHAAVLKVAADVDTELMMDEGVLVLQRAAAHPDLPAQDAAALHEAVQALNDRERPAQARLAAATSAQVRAVLARYPLREQVTSSATYPLAVERRLALFGSWYEFFPRSEGAVRGEDGTWRSGTFRTAAQRLPAIAEMAFDVVYLTPIHPIGTTNRKGRNNSLVTEPGDPGSPYATGSADGGHDAIHPDLGTIDDFDHFVGAARDLGLEVALDLALQCSPDHPWVTAHPEWFTTRADGSIAFAENPPKKYQDIYPVNFDNDPAGIYAEVLRVVLHWVDHGVTLFRVDNPHTKPVEFWEWLIAEVNSRHPEVIFLAEAFTRPAMMHTLAKVGFQQSYTYFTWRNTREELTSYLTELSTGSDVGPGAVAGSADFFRPSFWPTTHDILTPYMQYGGPAAFKLRAALAATMSPTWGIYSGYELVENVPRPGVEEQIDNEKYEYAPRDWQGALDAGRSLAPYLERLNRIRREHPALQQLRNIMFHRCEDPEIIAFSKRLPPAESPSGHDDTVIVVVNLDPHASRETVLQLDMPALGLQWHETFAVHDLISGEQWHWGERPYVRLDPGYEPAHVLHLRRV